MIAWVPGRFLWKVLEVGRSWKLQGLGSWKVWQDLSSPLTINKTSVRPDCGGLQMTIGIYFRRCDAMMHLCSRPIQRVTPAAASVAGGGAFGRSGPRIGASSGGWPGSSSGRAGSPGSCTGGGTSGRGFPGGLSTGGSVGCPGLIGGCSGGSIGIFITSPCGCLQDRARAGQRGCMFCSRPRAITAPASRCSVEPDQPGV
jgi:hypothetical protein